MKMKLIYLLSAMLLSMFVACNNDDEITPPAPDKVGAMEQIEGLFKSSGDITEGENIQNITATITFLPTSANTVQLKLSYIAPLGSVVIDNIPIKERDGGVVFEFKQRDLKFSIGECKADLEGTIENGEIDLELKMVTETKTYVLDLDGQKTKNNRAEILSMKIESNLVDVQPVIDGTTIEFYVKSNADISKLQFTPIYDLPQGTLINPNQDEKIDFSEVAVNGGAVQVIVVSEDLSKQVTYSVYCRKVAQVDNSFESWVKGVEGQPEELTFYEVANGWSSSNTGAHFMKAFSIPVDYPVNETKDAFEGACAAKISTIHSESEFGAMFGIPDVTSGTLFLGKFVTDMESPLKSTKFGTPFFKKPLRFQGSYKYRAGSNYYVADPNVMPAGTVTTIDNSIKDRCAINAVLYEVSDYSEEGESPLQYIKESLTGMNLFTATDKIVARAEVKQTSSDVAQYTYFDIAFEYAEGKSYDPAKRYMLAVVFASSFDGDKFCGAPGSTLWVDDIKIVTE